MAARGVRDRSRVLIIEDDEAIADMLRLIICDLGHEANIMREVPSAPVVPPPDLVISDLLALRPSLASGRAYTAALRRRFAGIPLLLLTAHTWMVREPDPSVDASLLKPFDLTVLCDQVLALLRTRVHRESAPGLDAGTPRSLEVERGVRQKEVVRVTAR